MSFCNITLLNWRKCKIELLSFQVSTTLILNSQNAVTILQYMYTQLRNLCLYPWNFFCQLLNVQWIWGKNPLLFREWFFPNELKKQEIALSLLLLREANFWSVGSMYIYYYCTQIVFVCIFFTINPRTNLWPFFVTLFSSCGWGLPKGLSRRLRHQQVKNAANSSNSVGFSIELLSLLLWNSQLTGQSLSIG